MDSTRDVRRAIEAAWRHEAARLVGGLTRKLRDLDLAEELAQVALLRALETWPETGIPDRPGAWLMTTATNAGLDELRRRGRLERTHASMAHASPTSVEPALREEPDVGDDVLRLMLAACHPVLSVEARTALTLRLLGGLSTEEIARAFLLPEPTVAQRIVRAKRTLAEAKVPFEVPRGDELSARVQGVIEVVYLMFNEGYAATSGETWMRTDLCEEALRLGRVLAQLAPGEAEVHGLVALMELQASRAAARVGPNGEPILLEDQHRGRWDQLAIQRGLAALAEADALARPLGPLALQAAIAACHARAPSVAETDWHAVVALYDALVALTGSPVVELNRAVAVAMAYGPEAGLELCDDLAKEPMLAGYHLVPAVRGDLLLRAGRREEARAELERAAFMTKNEQERALLVAKARRC